MVRVATKFSFSFLSNRRQGAPSMGTARSARVTLRKASVYQPAHVASYVEAFGRDRLNNILAPERRAGFFQQFYPGVDGLPAIVIANFIFNDVDFSRLESMVCRDPTLVLKFMRHGEKPGDIAVIGVQHLIECELDSFVAELPKVRGEYMPYWAFQLGDLSRHDDLKDPPRVFSFVSLGVCPESDDVDQTTKNFAIAATRAWQKQLPLFQARFN